MLRIKLSAKTNNDAGAIQHIINQQKQCERCTVAWCLKPAVSVPGHVYSILTCSIQSLNTAHPFCIKYLGNIVNVLQSLVTAGYHTRVKGTRAKDRK